MSALVALYALAWLPLLLAFGALAVIGMIRRAWRDVGHWRARRRWRARWGARVVHGGRGVRW